MFVIFQPVAENADARLELWNVKSVVRANVAPPVNPVDFASSGRLIKKLRFSQSAALQEQYSRRCGAPSIDPGGRR